MRARSSIAVFSRALGAILALFAVAPSGATAPPHPSAFLGVGLERVEGDTAAVRVLALFPDGPATRAGVELGDVIRSIDRRSLSIEAPTDVIDLFRDHAPGDLVALEIERTGRRLSIEVRATETPAEIRRHQQRLRRSPPAPEGFAELERLLTLASHFELARLEESTYEIRFGDQLDAAIRPSDSLLRALRILGPTGRALSTLGVGESFRFSARFDEPGRLDIQIEEPEESS